MKILARKMNEWELTPEASWYVPVSVLLETSGVSRVVVYQGSVPVEFVKADN